jgi:ParB-like chromosome segregation protein Spo0J
MNQNTELEFHEAANIFPLDEDHLEDLAADIRKNGQQVAIELFDGRILDGRRRYLACNKVGIEPKFREVKVSDPIAYVLSLNLYRRHLNPSQWAMVGARARDIYDSQAKERQKEGQKSGGRGHIKNSVENLPPSLDSGKARDHAAKAVGVSGKSIDFATKVIKDAVPEVVKAVDEGRMAVSTAAALASEPEDVQRHQAQFIPDGRPRIRKYKATANGAEKPAPQQPSEEDGNHEIKPLGVGVDRAHDAINCLRKIPRNDGLRKQGFQIVADWIKQNL